MEKLTVELLNAFREQHNIPAHATLCVSTRCIEVYDGEFRHFMNGTWHDGKMPEYPTIALQERHTGKMLGRFVRLIRGTWYNKTTIIN